MIRSTRRSFIARCALVGAAALSAACTTRYGQSEAVRGTPRRIGYLSNANRPTDGTPGTPSLIKSLSELGYVEGREFIVESRFTETVRERAPALAAELAALRVDVIVTAGGPNTALAAKQATSTIPVIFTNVPAPVDRELVANPTRPERNLTGVASSPLIHGKRLELLRETVRGLKRVAILFNDTDGAEVGSLSLTQDAAASLGIVGVPVTLNSTALVNDALRAIERARPDGLLDTHGSMFYGRGLVGLQPILEFAVKDRLPQAYTTREHVRAGGLMSLGHSTDANWRAVARLVDRVLKGEALQNLPVEVADMVDVTINLAMARKIGMTIPDAVLDRATEVIS